MIKYSFIIPVYNTAKYLNRCLDSIVKQTYKNFEIIIVNDGSTDNSKDIINMYKKQNTNIKVVEQKNSGLSVARNHGVSKSSGKYIVFVDSDDYIEEKLLEVIDKEIDNVDVLRYQVIEEDDSKTKCVKHEENGFDCVSGIKAFEKISQYYYVETAWCYVFNRKYFIKNKFSFMPNVYHEDYGLIPYIVYKASKVKSINYLGYHYITRQGSIMNNNDYNKTVKKAFDMLNQYKNLILISKKNLNCSNKDDYFLSYLSNCVIVKARELKGKEREKYINDLRRIKAFNGILTNSLIRKIKKLLMKLNLNLYLKVIR